MEDPGICVGGLVIRSAKTQIVFQCFTPLPPRPHWNLIWGQTEIIPVHSVHLQQELRGSYIYHLEVLEVSSRALYAARKNEQLATALLYDRDDRLTEALHPIRFPYPTVFDVPSIDSGFGCGTELLGKPVSAPFYLAGMTGGSSFTDSINQALARAAGELNLPMAVGSQRWLVESKSPRSSTYRHQIGFPDHLPFIGNIGLAEVLKCGGALIQQVAEASGADAVAVHLNILQELMQGEGQRAFINVVSSLKTHVEGCGIPVILKEVGGGISPEWMQELMTWNILGLEMASQAGTRWTFLEGLRSGDWDKQRISQEFSEVGWDASSQLKLIVEHRHRPKRPLLIASGGITQGIHVAKWIYAGADFCSVGRGALRVLFESDDPVSQIKKYLAYLKQSVELGMILTRTPRLPQFVGTWQP
jgi:isopentenyl-diphosphate delta-isomerase